ncbi:MAG: shikimate kinase [Pseudomonadota bacterium]
MNSHPHGATSEGAGTPGTLRRALVLVGMMGVGKTSIGQVLAKRLGARFADSDHEIELAAGLAVPEIFARFGEPYFRAGEARVIARLLDGPPLVLATGGGAFIEAATRELITARALAVWLRADLDTIYERVRGRSGRPLLATADPRATLAELAQRRNPVYALADLTVDGRPGERHEAAADRVLEALRQHDAAMPPDDRLLREKD